MINQLNQHLKEKIFGSYFFENYFSEINEVIKYISYFEISENTIIDFENFPKNEFVLLFIFNGLCDVIYKDEFICRILLDYPYILGEISYLQLINKSKIQRMGKIKVKDGVECISINIKNFDNFSDNIKIFLVEKIFKDLIKKIIISNSLYEKYKRINKEIHKFFTEIDKKSTIHSLENKIKKIIKKPHTKRLKFNKPYENSELETIYKKVDKDTLKKKFLFLKKNIIPQIKSLQLLPDPLIFKIAEKGLWLKFNKDEYIYYQGEKSDKSFLIILDGNVEIIVNDEVVNTLSGSFLLGEISLLNIPGQVLRRTATVKTLSETYAIKVNSEILGKYSLKNKINFYNTIIAQMVERQKDLNEKIYSQALTIKNFINNLKKSEMISLNDYKILYNTIFTIPLKGV